MEATTKRRRWWQFGLRDCLWLMVVAALAVGWWVRERELTAKADATKAEYAAFTHWFLVPDTKEGPPKFIHINGVEYYRIPEKYRRPD